MMPDDPLSTLVVDAEEVDRERLAELLRHRARIDPKQGAVRFLPGIQEEATIAQLLLITLFAQTAMHLLDDAHPRGLSPSELASATGVNGGSLRPQIKRLSDGGILVKDDSGRYTVPVHAVERAALLLEVRDE